jgi:hypothetical protein
MSKTIKKLLLITLVVIAVIGVAIPLVAGENVSPADSISGEPVLVVDTVEGGGPPPPDSNAKPPPIYN